MGLNLFKRKDGVRRIIVGRVVTGLSGDSLTYKRGSYKVRVPEFHRSGGLNVNFKVYKRLIGRGGNSLKIIEVKDKRSELL